MKRLQAIACSLLVSLAVSASVSAQTQSSTGVIQGTVLDSTKAVVPDAQIEIRNLDTNTVRTLTTDDNGRFVALSLQPGRYTVTVTKEGFAKFVQEGVTLQVGQAISLSLSMKVASATETVTVSGTPTIEVTETVSSTTLNQTTIETTPILGRKFEDLLTLTPGVSIVQGPDGDEITFSGQRGIFNNISLDGGDYNNGFFGEQVGGQRAAIDITLDAVKEFQVVASGSNAEFGRTAGGVINVVTMSGTNDLHGSLFYFQRLEALTANTSDGKSLTDFHREQFGATIGGPVIREKLFYFGAIEQITGNLQRDNLSTQIGPDACPVPAPVVPANEALINSNVDCQRLALLNFYSTTLNQAEGNPVRRPVHNTAFLLKGDWNVTPTNLLALSYNFNRSNKINETFDVATYGNSANGTEGPLRIQVLNANLFSTISPFVVNEGHFTYARENRPRSSVESNVPADTAMGFATTFRFGRPFFLAPSIDELFQRYQLRDNISIVRGKHTMKFGGEYIHSNNAQIFRGFFLGRYLFDSVTGFLRYAAPAASGGFGPNTAGCSDGSYVTLPAVCPGDAYSGGPLLFYLQGAAPDGIATDATGASDINNNEFALFAQDKWQVLPQLTLNFGLRWEAQLFPDPVVPPANTAYGQFLSNPLFPSDGTLHNQTKMFQPRIGLAWDVRNNAKSVLRASWGIYNARQNMLTQVGSITTNGVQQQSIFVSTDNVRLFGATPPVYPGVVTPPIVPPGTFPLFSGVRVFDSDYSNPRVYTANFAFEQELFPSWTAYVDFTWSKGVYLTRFFNINNGSAVAPTQPANTNTVAYVTPGPFDPQLGEVMLTNSLGKGLYRGLTIGMRKRLSNGFQFEWNYVYARDYDDDSNERDPFTDRSFNRFDTSLDYGPSDRDIRHKFNFFLYAELPWGFQGNARMQARTAQPITTQFTASPSGAPCSPTNSNTRVVDGVDCGRNHLRKDNAYFSFDWRLQRPFKFKDRFSLIPIVEMFNTFNNENNINPLTTPGLFNFDGFLRQGVGDPLQVQFAIKFKF